MEVSIGLAAEIIGRGGVVAFPTETVYGLGARADISEAVNRVYKIKNRPNDNPMICHFAHIDDVYEYVDEVPKYVSKLAQAFVPGPLSFRLKVRENNVLWPACAGQDSVVVRVPNHSIAQELIRQIGAPIIGPSANTSGKVSNTSAQMVIADLGNSIDGTLDGGSSQVGIESTIIDCTHEEFIRILRPGFIGVDDLMSVLGEEFSHVQIIDFDHGAILDVVPGLKYKHYAPDTRLQKITNLKANLILAGFTEDLKIINFSSPQYNIFSNVIDFGSIENQDEIARNLYSNIKKIDLLNPDLKQSAYFYILPQTEAKIKESGLGRAIMNRINRACAV